MKKVIEKLPDYCYSSSKMKVVNGIVIHYFSGKYQFPDEPFNPEKCIQLFKDLNRPEKDRKWFKMKDLPNRMYASAHYMISRDGTVYDLVPLPMKAWHAGRSRWLGYDNCNNWMLGIELIATQESGYTDAQYDALIELTEELLRTYKFPVANIAGHDHVSPRRKTDPGKLFDWERYRAMKTTKKSFINKLISLIPW